MSNQSTLMSSQRWSGCVAHTYRLSEVEWVRLPFQFASSLLSFVSLKCDLYFTKQYKIMARNQHF